VSRVESWREILRRDIELTPATPRLPPGAVGNCPRVDRLDREQHAGSNKKKHGVRPDKVRVSAHTLACTRAVIRFHGAVGETRDCEAIHGRESRKLSLSRSGARNGTKGKFGAGTSSDDVRQGGGEEAAP
jgi:hypothetical protein